MPAPSLVDSCTKACIKNVRNLTDVGDFEYWKLRTVLLRVESPDQLHQIELNSPQIRGEDAELWRALIARDIPNWRTKNYAPKNPEKWYEVYCKYKREQQEEIERDEAALRETMAGLKRKREMNVSKVMDLKALPKVPRDPRMLANNGGVPLGKKGGPARVVGNGSLTWTLGSKTKMTDGQSVLTRARREAKEISMRSKLSTPTHELKARQGQIRKAPAGMVNEYRTAAQPAYQPAAQSAVKILSRKSSVAKSQGAIESTSLEERERRLRALTSGGAGSKRDSSGAVKETLVGSSDDEDDYDSVDDLFDETPKAKARLVAGSTVRASRPSSVSNKQPRPVSHHSTPSSSRSYPTPKSEPSSTRPSELISSLVSKPKPKSTAPRISTQQSPPPASSPEKRSPAGSPAPGGPKPMMMARKKNVDVFNRGPKKPRTR